MKIRKKTFVLFALFLLIVIAIYWVNRIGSEEIQRQKNSEDFAAILNSICKQKEIANHESCDFHYAKRLTGFCVQSAAENCYALSTSANLVVLQDILKDIFSAPEQYIDFSDLDQDYKKFLKKKFGTNSIIQKRRGLVIEFSQPTDDFNEIYIIQSKGERNE